MQKTAIEVRHLSKSYGNQPAIDDISLSVKCGTVYVHIAAANGR